MNVGDPCPLPDFNAPRRTLSEKQKQLYAPLSDVGNVVLDKDATYIDIPDHKIAFSDINEANQKKINEDESSSEEESENDGEIENNPDGLGEKLVKSLQKARRGVDEKLIDSKISIFSHSEPISSTRVRRPAFADDGDDSEDSGEENESESDDELDQYDENGKMVALKDEDGNQEEYQFDDDDEDTDEEEYNSKKQLNIPSDDEMSSEEDKKAEKSGKPSKKGKKKEKMNTDWFENVEKLYKGKGKNLMDIVYDIKAAETRKEAESDDDSDDEGELLKLVKEKKKQAAKDENKFDTSKYTVNKEDWLDWKADDEVRDKLVSRFASAEWFDTVGEELMKDSDDEEVFGDFEDLEADSEASNPANDGNQTFLFFFFYFFILFFYFLFF